MEIRAYYRNRSDIIAEITPRVDQSRNRARVMQTPAPRHAWSKRRTQTTMALVVVVVVVTVVVVARPSALQQCDRLRSLTNDAHHDPSQRCRDYLEQRRALRSHFRYRDVARADEELIAADDTVLELMLRPIRYKDMIANWCRSYTAFLDNRLELDEMRRLTIDFARQLKKERHRADWVEKLVRDHLDLVIKYTVRILRQNLDEKHAQRIRIVRVPGDFKIRA